jgi:glycine hydroxymethyltransferase
MEKPWAVLESWDSEVYGLIEKELHRQTTGLELIASENFASLPVISAMANVFTNKYAEGRPSKRYYGGCEHVDALESLTEKRACDLFGAKYANVQPHSGAQANSSVMLALLEPKDKILSLNLSHGGHLSHGARVNSSGLLYEPIFYGLDDGTQRIDDREMERLARLHRPKLIIAGASAYPRVIDFKRFREVADEVGAYLLVDMAHIAGLVAAGCHPSPMPWAHVVTSTTHKTLRGPRGGIILWNDDSLTQKLHKGVFPGTQGGPLEHIIAAKAVCFKEALGEPFRIYQKKVIENSQALAQGLLDQGFTLVSGGTDNHLVLIDLKNAPISGKDLEERLGQIHITVNKNTVPNETRSPFITSGIRLGTPALTSRGFGPSQMGEIAQFVGDAAFRPHLIPQVQKQVLALAAAYPLYPEWNAPSQL